jgi:hypothetical protein
MRNTTSLWDNPLIDFSRYCGEDMAVIDLRGVL